MDFAVHHSCISTKTQDWVTKKVVHKVNRHLKSTKKVGMISLLYQSKGIKYYVDADFSCDWNSIDFDNSDNVLSRNRYVIMYCGCPLVWKSKIQTQIALSTTKSYYITLLQSMCKLIPLFGILFEITHVFGVVKCDPHNKYYLFNNNNSCLALTKAQHMNPCTNIYH